MIADALADGRAAAESRMVDTCTVSSVERTWNEEQAKYTDSLTTVYAGMCEVKSENVEAESADSQGRLVTVVRRTLKLPVVGSELVREGNRVHIDSCVNDPGLVGNTYVIGAFTGGSFLTARRLPITEDQPS